MRVGDFVWRHGEPAPADVLASADDLRRSLPSLSGQFALHVRDGDGGDLLVRDRLGVNKLFFALDGERVRSSNYIVDLVGEGHPLERIFSVPMGCAMTIRPSSRHLELAHHASLDFAAPGGEEASLETCAERIRARLETVFERLGQVLSGRCVFVTLSGGLDSTTIAALARRHLGSFTAVTFAMADPRTGTGASDDLDFARLVADRLGVPIETVSATGADVAAFVDLALLYGQDWRDFNVHCAVVNAVIADHLARRYGTDPAGRPVVLTGDVMNELMADYAPVTLDERTYYRLPRLPLDRLRRHLVAGLDAGDREVGVFARFGIDVIQPYALVADAYAALPSSRVEGEQAKQRLARAVMGDAIPEEIYERPKVRAQIGGDDGAGGTLRALLDAGVTRERLRARFAELLGCSAAARDRLIRAGFYRSTTVYPM